MFIFLLIFFFSVQMAHRDVFTMVQFLWIRLHSVHVFVLLFPIHRRCGDLYENFRIEHRLRPILLFQRHIICDTVTEWATWRVRGPRKNVRRQPSSCCYEKQRRKWNRTRHLLRSIDSTYCLQSLARRQWWACVCVARTFIRTESERTAFKTRVTWTWVSKTYGIRHPSDLVTFANRNKRFHMIEEDN